jgi:hypothetical protein
MEKIGYNSILGQNRHNIMIQKNKDSRRLFPFVSGTDISLNMHLLKYMNIDKCIEPYEKIHMLMIEKTNIVIDLMKILSNYSKKNNDYCYNLLDSSDAIITAKYQCSFALVKLQKLHGEFSDYLLTIC